MTVNPQGGQFLCPVCQTVNVVAAQIGPAYHAGPVHVQYQMPAPPKKKEDNRRAFVLGAFMVLGVAALFLQWVGIAVGAGLLAWGIAGAMGKVKGPMELLFHDSTKTTALAALSIGLGVFVTTCGAMGIATEANRKEKEARDAQEKAEREAAAKAERERKAAEEAAARAAREAELLAGAEKATSAYASGLDAVQALVDSGKWRDADAKLEEVSAAVADYRTLDPVPQGIAAATPREEKLRKAIAEVVAVLDAADALETNIADAAKLTDGTKDGAAWKSAQSKWQEALANIDTLEKAGKGEMQDHVPNGLPAKRAAIEKSLAQAQKIVAKYDAEQAELEAKQAAREAYNALCGPEGCVEVTATALLKDYANNEAAAQGRWSGKRVAVSGIVESVSLDLFDDPVVSIRGNDRYSFQSVMCKPEHDEAANKLSKGQRILAIGTIGTEVIGSVVLDDCNF